MKNTNHTITTLFTSIIFISVTLGLLSCSDAEKKKSDNVDVTDNLIFPQGEKITNTNFTGTAYLKMLMEADSINPTAVGNVTFEPGARTKWHYHPAGQILLVTDGVGYYQEKGQSKKILRKGDIVKCPPNTPHWHGATADLPFVQVAVTNNHLGPTVWQEAVTNEEYNSGVSNESFEIIIESYSMRIMNHNQVNYFEAMSKLNEFFGNNLDRKSNINSIQKQ